MNDDQEWDLDAMLRRALLDYGSGAVPLTEPPGANELTNPRASLAHVVPGLALVCLIGLGLLLAIRLSSFAVGSGLAPASSCDEVSSKSVIDCSAARLSVSWGDVRIDRVRIWLTTLGAVKSTMNPPQQVVEPPATTPVWVFVYDGNWNCCLAGTSDGLAAPTDHSRWLRVVDATRDDGSFIYIADWSGKDVPETLPAAGVGG